MNNQNQGASIEAEREYLRWWTAIETDTRKSMMVSAHREPERLHALVKMAFCAGLDAARRTPAAAVGAGELPPMPDPMVSTRHGTPCYTVGQMMDYARAAVAADRAQRHAPVVREVPDDGEPIYGQREEEAGHKIKAAGLMEEASILCEAARRSQARLDYRFAASTATVTAPAQPADANWQYRVSAGPATGWSQWHPGRGDEFENSYKVERRRVTAAPAAQQGAPISADRRFMDALDAYMDAVTYDERNSDKRIACRLEIFAAANAWRAAIAGAASALEKLPQWIDDLKGKDPTIDDLITYILYVRALAARYSTKVDQLLAAPAPAPAPATAGMVEDAKDAARLDFLEQIAERKEDSMPNVRAFGKTFVAETLREAIDAAMAAQQAQASAKWFAAWMDESGRPKLAQVIAKESGAMGDDLKGVEHG